MQYKSVINNNRLIFNYYIQFRLCHVARKIKFEQ